MVLSIYLYPRISFVVTSLLTPESNGCLRWSFHQLFDLLIRHIRDGFLVCSDLSVTYESLRKCYAYRISNLKKIIHLNPPMFSLVCASKKLSISALWSACLIKRNIAPLVISEEEPTKTLPTLYAFRWRVVILQ